LYVQRDALCGVALEEKSTKPTGYICVGWVGFMFKKKILYEVK